MAGLRLVCFPHASGNATFYRRWADRMPADAEVLAVQYPGRLDRIAHPFVDDLATMADLVTEALLPVVDRPVALFGHSMGAMIAYEVACRLERRIGARLTHLIVSGRPPPCHHQPTRKHRYPDDLLWNELRRLGGTTEDALNHPELRASLMPVLRADYRLVDTYRPAPQPPLSCPLTAMGADADPEAAVPHLRDWHRYTRGGFALRVYPGGHFYLADPGLAVVAEVADVLGLGSADHR
jgi:pyochelin biosynthetic protein PchC